jgi:TIR domain-containing protein
MFPQPPSTKARSSSIFLSHAHEDRPFVLRLARDLASYGVRVWIDEAEMGVGDSLLEKITTSISEMDYLGVVISPHSSHSDWVTREVEIA